MKKVLIHLALSLFMAIPAMAQVADEEPNSIDKEAAKISERLTQALALSEDQREEVYAATVDMLEEKSENKKTRGEIQKAYDEALSEILNDEQYQQYMEGAERAELMYEERKTQHEKKMKNQKDY